MYAIIEACGRQYKVEEGMTVYFEKLNEEEGKKVTFDKVVLISNNGKVEVGSPVIAGAKVEGKVVSNGRGKKILVFKYKAKKNERKTRGHRQDYTKVEITSIKTAAKKATKAADKAEKVEA
ncbi:MAG: 50S ribosomal protein L21 [Clostridia bacterium]|nr:50S ribosomal protein L21 [Clostridia bacterium]